MGAVLVTGMSGAGKSTALAALADRGHRTVDTDEGDWIEVRDGERLWRADRVTALLDRHRDGPLFVSGTVANQGEWYPRFDAVVLLTAPLEVLLARVATRTTNGFGRAPGERRRIVEDTTVVEPLLRRRATAVIDTRAPLEEVVDALLRAAGVTPGGR